MLFRSKGEYVPYTNKINEQFDQHMTEEKEMCSECGGMMREGECSECGWKGEMEEGKLEDIQDKVLDWIDKEGDTKLEKAIKKIGDFLIDLEDKVDGVKGKKKKEETKEGVLDFLNKKKSVRTFHPYEAEAIEKKIGRAHV